MIEYDQSIQSATRVVLKSKNDKVSDENATFKIKMLKNDEKALKNYKKDYLKTDKNGYISMYDGVRWINTFTLKKGECVLPVVLPDGLYKLSDFSIKHSKIKSTRVSVSSEIISGLDEDSQPGNNCVVLFVISTATTRSFLDPSSRTLPDVLDVSYFIPSTVKLNVFVCGVAETYTE